MKIPMQEKIAELERRIEALEKRNPEIRTVHPKVFGKHWHRMWQEFDEVMKQAFGRK
jgi:hypothetical protein